MSLILLSPALVGPPPPIPPTAGSLTPRLWLSGDRIGGQSFGNPKIVIWSEEGTLNAMSQFDSSLQPSIVVNGLNSLPVVNFGLGQNLRAAQENVAYTTSWTLVAVVKASGQTELANLSYNPNGAQVVFFNMNGTTLSARVQHSNTQLASVTWPGGGVGTWNVVAITYLGNGLGNGFSAWVNGVLQTATITNDSLGGLSTSTDAPWFVGSPGSLTGGQIAEVLLFISHLSTTDRQTVESYLTNKWFTVPTPIAPGTGVKGTGMDILRLTAFPIAAPLDQDQ